MRYILQFVDSETEGFPGLIGEGEIDCPPEKLKSLRLEFEKQGILLAWYVRPPSSGEEEK